LVEAEKNIKKNPGRPNKTSKIRNKIKNLNA
jgi:hypothetical protein